MHYTPQIWVFTHQQTDAQAELKIHPRKTLFPGLEAVLLLRYKVWVEPNKGLEANSLQEENGKWDKNQVKFVKKSCLNTHTYLFSS